MIYGCHSDKAPINRCLQNVEHSKGSSWWPYIFSRMCQYDNKSNDIKCNGCKHEHKDDVMFNGLTEQETNNTKSVKGF